MSVLDGPGEGTWSVFAEQVVAERDEARAQLRKITEQYKPGWVQGLEAVARNNGYDPDKARHEGVEPPDFIEDVIEKERRMVNYWRTRYEALVFQIENEGCVAAHKGELTYECDVTKPCGLCRMRAKIEKLEDELLKYKTDGR